MELQKWLDGGSNPPASSLRQLKADEAYPNVAVLIAKVDIF